MKRSLADLADAKFDLVIVGGGIFGACAAWDAVLRGLSVALVERGDFCGGTSANSFKMVHGGIRYLQHADIVRLRASCGERSALLRIAPHLVQPLPIVIPTYGYGKAGKGILGAGMLLYDSLTLGRNRGIRDPARRIPRTRFLSRGEVLEQFPDLPREGLTGGAVFCDGQMYNPPRLVLAFIRSAVEAGARVANYLEAVNFVRSGNRVEGIEVRDALTGQSFAIRARAVLNTAGPWAERLLTRSAGISLEPKGVYSRDACFVVSRRLPGRAALAVQGRTRDPDAVLSRPARHLFLVPWREYTLVGVWHLVYERSPDEVTVPEQDLQAFIDEINWAYPPLHITIDEVRMWNAGLVPFGENEPGAVNLRYGKRSTFVDHEERHGIQGLVTLIGVRYTTARGDSAPAVDRIAGKLGVTGPRPPTESKPIHGGNIEDFEALVKRVASHQRLGLPERVARALSHNYGAAVDQILQLAGEDASLAGTLGDTTVLKAEVVNALRNEMAVTLADVVFRRTDLATGGSPGGPVLHACADIVANELGWSTQETERQLQEVAARFPVFRGA